MAFFEIRQYKVQPGKMDAWLKVMEEEIIPFQVDKGMVILASFRGETDDSVYFWMRRFESEAQREQLYAAVYESDQWKNVIGPKARECLVAGANIISRVVPTPRSPIQ
jgi:hypothetical protein